MAKVRERVLPGTGKRVWLCDYRDGAGKRRFRQFDRRRDADAFMVDARAEVRDGVHTADAASKTVKEAAALFLTRCETENLRPSTVKNYKTHIDLYILPKFGGLKLTHLTTPMIEAWKDELLNTRSRALAAQLVGTLRAILKEARRRGLLAQNAATGVKVDRRRAESDDGVEDEAVTDLELKIPTQPELHRMLERVEAACGARWRPFLVAALGTGLRQSELRALTWNHVDLVAGLIRVRRRADYKRQIGAPKSAAGKRDVPIGPFVVNTLKTWKIACPPTKTNLVFPTPRSGAVWGMAKIWRLFWWPLMASAGLLSPGGRPKYRFHDLRHCAATAWIAQGVTPKRIQVLMGHGSIALTFNTYGSLWTDKDKDRADAAKVEAALFG